MITFEDTNLRLELDLEPEQRQLSIVCQSFLI